MPALPVSDARMSSSVIVCFCSFVSVLAGCIVAIDVAVTMTGGGVAGIAIVGDGDDVGDIAAQPVDHSTEKISKFVKGDDLVVILKDMCVLTGQLPSLRAYFR